MELEWPADLLEFLAWIVAAVIAFKAWRRYHDRDAKVALVGFLVVLGSPLARYVTLLILGDASASGAVTAYTITVIATYLGGMAGGFLIAYAFWRIVRSHGSLRRIEQGDHL